MEEFIHKRVKKMKIIELDKLSKIINVLRKKKKIVQCHGVFDLLHPGHIIHLKQAKSKGDVLVVTLTPDKFVNKGPNRPAFNQNLRAETLASLSFVDYVSISNSPDAIKAINLIKPYIYFKGQEYKQSKKDITKKISLESNTVKKHGGKILFTSGKVFSSSNLINQYLGVHENNQNNFIKKLKERYNFNFLKQKIEDFKKLKILIIGEAIIDEYIFCEALGKSGKDPMIMYKKFFTKKYFGGSLAVANNINNFTNKINLYCMIGKNDNYRDIIIKKKTNKIKINFLEKKNSPTVKKTKYIDEVNNIKVFGTYEINDSILTKEDEKKAINFLNKNIKKFDIVIVSDYGHGFITDKLAKTICSKSNFLALNTQVNAANTGYHSINKYKNANCVIINETELRQDLRNRYSPLEKLMLEMQKKIRCKYLIVTKGKHGSILHDKKSKKFYRCPAFANKVVDKIGAGDAMLCMVSMALFNKLGADFSLFLGSLASQQSVESFANEKSVDKIKILQSIKYFMK